ncbi:MAG: hypothetical protein HGA31_04210 [Candidatus Moranbacteria bacterium]|nr:hypothetical protein [Candidatus Moranbacteria bacterium]
MNVILRYLAMREDEEEERLCAGRSISAIPRVRERGVTPEYQRAFPKNLIPARKKNMREAR